MSSITGRGERGTDRAAFADEIAAFVETLNADELRLMWRWIFKAWIARYEQERGIVTAGARGWEVAE